MNAAKTVNKAGRFDIGRILPIVAQLKGYQLGWLKPDILAGITVCALTVPEAMAYASIAGVPPEIGLYTAPAALILYAIFATSRHLVVAPSTTVAIVSASVVAPLAAGGSNEYIALTAALAVITGVVMIVAGVVRLGFITDFFAKSVLDGFVILNATDYGIICQNSSMEISIRVSRLAIPIFLQKLRMASEV